MIRSTVQLAGVAALVWVLAACASTPEESETEAAETGSEFSQAEPAPPPSSTTSGAGLELATVFFDYDRAEIREDARPALRTNAETIRGSDATVTIEGHCDERGNEEYNLALGERRANSVKRYLANLGVPGSQLRTLSYGEAKPSVAGHDESAWRYNRRAEFRAR